MSDQEKLLTPPREIIRDILDQRCRQLLDRQPLTEMYADLSVADLKTVQTWWKKCTGEPDCTFLLGCVLRVR